MGVLPGGPQPVDWGSRQAAANEALTKLYLSLIARREDRESGNALRRELANLGYDKAMDLSDRQAENRMAHDRYFYPPAGGANRGPSPLQSGGAAGSGRPTVPVPPTGGPPAVKGIPGSVAPAGAVPGSQTFQKSAANMPQGQGALMMTMARLAQQREGGTQEGEQTNSNDPEYAGELDIPTAARPVSGQLPAGGQIVPRKGEAKQSTGNRPAGQLPPDQQPGNPRSKTPPKAQAQYGGIDKEITDYMREMETKYKLPRGVLRTIIGFENDGGYNIRKDPNSSAQGWYAFTNGLIDEWKHPRSDRYNVYTMTELAAQNLARNRNALEKATAGTQGGVVKLGDSVADIPFYTTLHQWGIGDGPRIVAAMKRNPNVAMVDVMQKGKDNGVVLMNNDHDPHSTVGQYASKHYGKIKPWITKAVEADQAEQQQVQQPQGTPQQGDKPGTVKTTEFNTAAPAAGDGSRRQVIGNFRRANGVIKELVAAVKGGAELALPDGYTVHATSGHRPEGRRSSHHYDREAIDIQIHGPDGPIANKGGDPTGMYQLLVRGVKTWAQENDQELLKYLGWGAAFETSKGSGTTDEMHIDLGGSRGRLDPSRQFSKLKPLTPEERQRPGTTVAGADGSYQGGQKPAPKEPPTPMFAGGGTAATDVMPKSLPAQGQLGTSDLLGKDNMTRNFKPSSVPNSQQNAAFAGAPPNPPPAPPAWQGPQQPITRGQPPTPEPQITRGAPPTAPPEPDYSSPEYRGFPTVPPIENKPDAPVAEKPSQGQVQAGNIDVTKRPTALLGKPITVTNENGQEVLIPTIDEAGKEMTDDEAVQHYAKTGKHLGVFDSADNANRRGEQLAETAVSVASDAVAEKPVTPTMKGNVKVAADDAKKSPAVPQLDQAQAATSEPTPTPATPSQYNQLEPLSVTGPLKTLFGGAKKAITTTPPTVKAIKDAVYDMQQKSEQRLPTSVIEMITGASKPTPAAPIVPPNEGEMDNPQAPWMQQGPDALGWLTKLFKSKPIEIPDRKVKTIPFGPPDPTAAPANVEKIDIKPVGAPAQAATPVPYGDVPAMQTGGEYRPATPTRAGMKMINGKPMYWQYGEPEPGEAVGTPPVDAAPVLEPVE